MKPLYFILMASLAVACNQSKERASEGTDSLNETIKYKVTAFAETDQMPQATDEDAADDPAIFVDYKSGNHLIYGSDKKGGVGLYDLKGNEVKYYSLGKINNIDIRQNIPVNDTVVSIIAGSDRTNNGLFAALLDQEGKIIESTIALLPSKIKDEVYGFCLGFSSADSSILAFVNSKVGELEKWSLSLDDSNAITGSILESIEMNAQTEGLVMDDAEEVLYLGVEEKGIWRFNLSDSALVGHRIPNSGPEDNENIVMDIEGISIYATDSEKYLIASSQGNYSYAIFDLLKDGHYLTSFKIIDGTVDGVEETDGLDVTSYNMGNGLDKGILVVQDGFNRVDGKIEPQNFKYIDFNSILEVIHANQE